MKKLMFNNRLLLLLLPIGLLLSCSEDEEVTRSEKAPELPPISTFTIEMGAFKTESNNGRSDEENYYLYSAANYIGWQTALTLYLAHPVVAFRAAFDQTPRFINEEDRWVWDYNAEAFGQKYQIVLYGKKVGSNAEWEMRASQDGGFQDVLWFRGTSALDGSEGTWNVMTDAKNPRDAMLIKWEKSEGEIPYVKYTGLDTESSVYQNYIEYGSLTNNDDFNVFYNIYDSEDNNLLKIEFNNKTKAGRVTDSGRFGDGEWHCWNGSYENISCE